MRNGRPMEVYLAQPRGFCAGVERAVEIVELALEKYGPPVYVRHEIVHNKRVVEKLRSKGALFVDELDEFPTARSRSSAPMACHRRCDEEAPRAPAGHRRHLPAGRQGPSRGPALCREGHDVILIGHEGHPEVEGTRGRIPGGVHLVQTCRTWPALTVRNADRGRLHHADHAVASTTPAPSSKSCRSVSQVVGPDVRDICYATQNRQEAVGKLAQHVDSSWWWAPPTAPIPTVCARSARR